MLYKGAFLWPCISLICGRYPRLLIGMTVLSGQIVNAIIRIFPIRPMAPFITPAAYPALPLCARPQVAVRAGFSCPAAIVFRQFVNCMSDVSPELVIPGTNVIPTVRPEGSSLT